jgi:hypothetical protein
MVIHKQNLALPFKTMCSRFWALYDRGIVYVKLNAVDDWHWVTCKNCLNQKPNPQSH